MAPPPDPRRNILETVFVLRPEVRFIPQIEGNQTHFIIEDPLNSKYYRVGTSEYELISLLNGKRTLAEALHILHVNGIVVDLAEDTAQKIGHWLLQSELATSKSDSDVQQRTFMTKALQPPPRWSRLNPISIKLPLLQPERILPV